MSQSIEQRVVHLQVIDGPDKGKMFFLKSKRDALIGRHVVSDLRLTDPGVSQKHCSISSAGDVVWLEDLKSRNGTKIDGKPITKQMLDRETVIEIGTSKVQISWVATERAVPLGTVESDFAPTLLETSTLKSGSSEPIAGSTIVGASQLQEFRTAQAMLGKMYANFMLLEVIGVGAFGFVFRCKDTKAQQEVAIKLIRRSNVKTPKLLQKFLSECQTGLNVANAVNLISTGEDGDFGYIVMDLARGTNLQSAIENERKFSAKEAAEIGVSICQTLHAAHQRGIFHRDIRPSNIVISKSGPATLLDLGMGSKTDGEGKSILLKDHRLETGAYLSPELTRHSTNVDARADVYGLAATLYSVLCGKKPYSGSTWIELVRKIRWESPPMLSELRKDVPLTLATAIARAMEKEPERRYSDMSYFETALRNAIT